MSKMTIEVQNADEVNMDLAEADRSLTQRIQGQSMEDFAEELKDEFIETSPVRTGEYQSSWDMREEDDGYVIYNDADHAIYLVLPNQNMVGSSKADDPGRGITHDVRGIVFRRRRDFKESISRTLRRALRRA